MGTGRRCFEAFAPELLSFFCPCVLFSKFTGLISMLISGVGVDSKRG